MGEMSRYVVVGGGIVGLATAYRLATERRDAEVTVVEKEHTWGAHQTGHNSGVIHAGVYYRPGSLKARLCKAGSASMVEFCTEHGIPAQVCGKLIVATDPGEVPRLRALYERAVANELPVRLIGRDEAREHEPHVSCVAAMHVASTGIVDFGQVCAKLAELLDKAGAWLRPGERVTGVRPVTAQLGGAGGLLVRTNKDELRADVLVNCAGLHADRVARMAGVDPPARIVPFRGEYFELRPDRRHLVRGLIYPVPDPRFPFLGVHLTRMIDGSVHAGPNAVLALAREGYTWRRVRPRDVFDTATYSGLWHLGRRHFRYGWTEMRRSLSRKLFAASLARLVPEITAADLVKAEAGVRAQAVTPAGDLVDDFLIVNRDRQVHVLNAPSPAATSALEIARRIVRELP
jgi:(S)-2-hydroxyglutarate dehydrogenase